MAKKNYYIAMFSIHGLVRGHDMELGRDADTGGQVQYVIELARELGNHADVSRVDLFTRQIFDNKVSDDYAKADEPIGSHTHIIRLPCGPRRYLRKEILWDHLDAFVDHTLQYFRKLGRMPDLIHAHYADAGYVGAMLANLLEIPLIFTGHSLGRVKKQRLREKGLPSETIEEKYNISRRIEAEETALNVASLIITSTHQEIEEQYAQYDNYIPNRMVVIPPGINLDRYFYAPDYKVTENIQYKLNRFFNNPNKPLILAIARADERKNLTSLLEAYGQNTELQETANLAIIAGNRQKIKGLEREAQKVIKQLLYTIDDYDLYGKVAYPKQHSPEEVPEFYRYAASTAGVFVNPALTEPFGLTLIEAAASGLPVVATQDGGPIDITNNCKNGVLIDPLNISELGQTLLNILTDKKQWLQYSENGVKNVKVYYTWHSHAESYFKQINPLLDKQKRSEIPIIFSRPLSTSNRALICDIDNTLIGDTDALKDLIDYLQQAHAKFSFGIATGRHIDSALEVLQEWEVPLPDILITSVGSEIYYGASLSKNADRAQQKRSLIVDQGWRRHINWHWDTEQILEAMAKFEGLTLQPPEMQRAFKISYDVEEPKKAPSYREIVRHLRKNRFRVNVIYSHEKFLDILPVRASKGLAIRYLALKWGLPIEQFLVAGDSGNDEGMLTSNTLGVIVGNYSKELDKLRRKPNPKLYFAHDSYARGVLEGLRHYEFLDTPDLSEEGN